VFADITVTPFYDAAQYTTLYPFLPDTLDGGYPTVSPQTLAGDPASHAPLDHGECGQTNGGTWTMP
jgi:hypothetical protein